MDFFLIFAIAEFNCIDMCAYISEFNQNLQLNSSFRRIYFLFLLNAFLCFLLFAWLFSLFINLLRSNPLSPRSSLIFCIYYYCVFYIFFLYCSPGLLLFLFLL